LLAGDARLSVPPKIFVGIAQSYAPTSPVACNVARALLICACSHVAIQPITETNWLCVIAPLASAAFAEARRIATNIAKLPELFRKP
jgi:hypothetical protein